MPYNERTKVITQRILDEELDEDDDLIDDEGEPVRLYGGRDPHNSKGGSEYAAMSPADLAKRARRTC